MILLTLYSWQGMKWQFDEDIHETTGRDRKENASCFFRIIKDSLLKINGMLNVEEQEVWDYLE
jgi:hypothetical protein